MLVENLHFWSTMLFVPPSVETEKGISRAGLIFRGIAKFVRRWRLAALLGLAAAGVAMYYAPPLIFGPLVQTEAVTRADFVQSVVASGSVLAPYRVNVSSQITGTVVDVPVAEGQTVSAGDVLIHLDDREARASVVQAEGVLAQAEARVRQMRELTLPSAREAMEQTQATLKNAEETFKRAQTLANSGYGTRATLDEATKSLNIAQAQFRSAQFQFYSSSPGGADYVMAETQLRQSQASLDVARSRLSYTTITAPRNGILIARNVEKGYVVQPGGILMVLSPSGSTQLVVQIDEKNLGLIAIGQKAIVSADAFPKATFAAEVTYINPGIDLQRASVQVKLSVPEPPTYLQQDMTVSVDIETARHRNVTVAPTTSIRALNGERPWVLKVKEGRAHRQEIVVGLVSGGQAEVLNGLGPGDKILPASSSIEDGDRVRLVATRGSSR